MNRALAAGGTVSFDPGRSAGDARYVVSGLSGVAAQLLVNEFGLRVERRGNAGEISVRSRIALYKPWRASMDEGWTRWLLDQYEFSYTTITNADFQAGELGSRFDVIVLASDRPGTLLNGYAKGSVPPRYEGGVGEDGVRALDAFVRGGGTLVCLNQSSDFAIQQLHLPVRNVVSELDRKDFFANGSIVEVITDPAHPVMAGMPERASVFVDRSPVFTGLEEFDGVALAKYQNKGSPLLSGYLLGEEHMQGYAAAVDVRHGEGHVILIGFRPQWRGQPLGTFRIVFNSILFGQELARRSVGTEGFWSPPVDEEAEQKESHDGGTY